MRYISPVALTVLSALLPAPTRAADPAPGAAREFKLSFVCETKVNADRETASFTIGNDYHYTWERVGQERTLLFREIGFSTKSNDGKSVAMVMNRASATTFENGKVTKELKYGGASDLAREEARELFESPLCKQKLDETGAVLSQTITAGPKIKHLFDRAALANINLLHPPFPVNKDEWRTEAALNLSGIVTGTVEYKKAPGGKGGQLVKVTGAFKAANEIKLGDLTKTNTTYTMTGTQTYDPDRKDWVAGNLEVVVSADLVADGKVFGTEKGKAVITFEMLPEKKTKNK